MVIIIGLGSPAAGENAEIQIRVLFGEEDYTLEAQVMLFIDNLPLILGPGQEKVVSVPAGSYEIMAMLPNSEVSHLPGGGEVTFGPEEVKEVVITLQEMPSGAGFQMPDIPDISGTGSGSESTESVFSPAEASEEELYGILDSDNQEDRQAAFQELYKREGFPFVTRMLDHPEGEMRESALQVLYNISVEWAPTSPIDDLVPEIVALIEDPYEPARLKAVQIIFNYRDFPPAALAPLYAALEDENEEIRISAARSLGGASSFRQETAPYLIDRLEEDESAQVRKQAVYSLGRIQADDPGTAEALAAGVLDPDPEVRQEAAQVLSTFPGDVTPVVSSLIAALQDSAWQVRTNVLRSLQNAEQAVLAESLDQLIPLLSDEDRYVRVETARTLEVIGPSGAAALPTLRGSLADERFEVKTAVIKAIIALGPDQTQICLPEFLGLMIIPTTSASRQTLWSLAEAFTLIGEPAVPSLTELLEHEMPEARARSAAFLGRIGPAALTAVPVLTSLYKDETELEAVRREAYYAVENITGERPEL